jgi:hypothetical protein
MGKKNKGDANTKKKGKNDDSLLSQKLRKAERCLQSSGKRGLDTFLMHNTDIKSNKTVEALLRKAASLKVRPPKGQRGPKSAPKQKASTAQGVAVVTESGNGTLL